MRLTGLNCLGSVVRGIFATGVTIARRQSSGTWAVWNERLNIRASTGEMWELRALRTLGKRPSGQAPLRGLRPSRVRLTYSSVMSGSAFRVCVRGRSTGVDPSSSRKNSRKVVLRSSAISWSEFIRGQLGWCSCRMRAVNRLFLF